MAAAQSTAPPIVHAIAGSIGSALSLLLLYPLERARIELQTQATNHNQTAVQNDELESMEVELLTDASDRSGASNESTIDSPLSSSPSSSTNPAFLSRITEVKTPTCSPPSPSGGSLFIPQRQMKLGVVDCLRRLHERGVLYQGVTPVITTIFTSQFVFFFLLNYVKRHMIGSAKAGGEQGTSSTVLNLVSSCLAGMGNVLITNPLWVVNMAIVTGEAKSQNLWRELYVMTKKRGPKHMWNGTAASILLVSNPIIQFFCYEQLKQARLLRTAMNHDAVRSNLSPVEAFLLGASAKAISTVSTYPLQLCQTVLRLKDNGYKGIIDCLVQLYKRGGMTEWYTGMRAKLLQTVLSAAFTFLSYEQILGVVQTSLIRSRRIKVV